MKKKLLLIIFVLFVGLFGIKNVSAKLVCEYDEYKIVFNSNISLDNAVVYKNNQKLSDVYIDFEQIKCYEKIYITEIDGIYISQEPFDLVQPDDIEELKNHETINTIPFTCKYGEYEIIFDMSDNSFESTKVKFKGKEYVYPEVIVNFKEKKCPSDIDVYDVGYLLINKKNESSNNTPDETIGISSSKTYCGSGEGIITDIPKKIPELTSMMFTIVQVAVPIILVIMGSIDLFKGITSGKEDEMKKGRQMFIKRLVVGTIIFLVVIIVKFIISIVADTGVANMVDCIDCFISNNCGGM